MNLESYAHRAAKKIIVEWANLYCGSGHVVWQEYPIGHAVGDALNVDRNGVARPWRDLGWQRIPSYDELKMAGQAPEYILDVAIIRNDEIKCAIEIVHTSPPSKVKLFDITWFVPQVFVIPAEWILRKTKPQGYFPPEFRISAPQAARDWIFEQADRNRAAA